MRSLITFGAMIAALALAGCGMPAESDVAGSVRPPERKAALDPRDAHLRQQVEAGTFGLKQLFPGGVADVRRLPPLPRTSAVAAVRFVPASASASARAARLNESAKPKQLAFIAMTGRPDACVYKPVMSDADLDACR